MAVQIALDKSIVLKKTVGDDDAGAVKQSFRVFSVDGKDFVEVRKSREWKKLIPDDSWSMMERMQELRNEAVDAIVIQSWRDNNKDAPDTSSGPSAKRAKREIVVDDLPHTTAIQVADNTGAEASITVLATTKSNEALSIEATQSNVEWLFKKPPDDAKFSPSFAASGMHWVSERNCVRMRYVDKDGKASMKEKRISFPPSQEAVDAAAKVVAEFVDANKQQPEQQD